MPLSTVTFATLAPHYRNEGTSLLSLARIIGSSIGISLVMTYLAQRTQINHAAFADFRSPLSLSSRQAVQAGAIDLSTPQGLSMLNAEVSRQAATLAYLQDFRLMMWVTPAATPLLLLRAPAQEAAHAAME